MATGDSVLELVTSDPKQPGQTIRSLGSFLGTRTGFQYRNFPLTDGTGLNNVIRQFSGPTTLRLRQVTTDPSDGSRYQNYLIFVPVEASGIQRATIAALSPAAGSIFESATPSISATIQNRDTTVDIKSIKLFVNGQAVTSVITPSSEGASLSYNLSPLPPSGSAVNGRIEFTDSQNVTQTNEWAFTLSYHGLDATNRASGTAGPRGFNMRVVQALVDAGAQENSLARAELQLTPNSTIAEFVDTNVVVQVVNFSPDGSDAGEFPGDQPVPGLEPEVNGTVDFATEIEAYLDLSAGLHRFGVVSDDGFSIRSSNSLTDKTSTPLAFRSGGTANQTFDFIVPVAGLYPFRMVWYQRGGGANAEWFSVDPATGEKTLINDSASPTAVKAYTGITGPTLILESAGTVDGPYTKDATGTIDAGAGTVTIPLTSARARFFRLNGAAKQRIESARVSGNTLTLTFGAAPL